MFQPTDTQLGDAIRHMLDTKDLSGVPWIMDTLQELGRTNELRLFRRNLYNLAISLNSGWESFHHYVEADFWHDLYTLESVIASAHTAAQRDSYVSDFVMESRASAFSSGCHERANKLIEEARVLAEGLKAVGDKAVGDMVTADLADESEKPTKDMDGEGDIR